MNGAHAQKNYCYKNVDIYRHNREGLQNRKKWVAIQFYIHSGHHTTLPSYDL